MKDTKTMSNETTITVVETVSQPEVVPVTYKVIKVTNKVTKEHFYAVRKESVIAFAKRSASSARSPLNYQTVLMESIREYGQDNHSYSLVAEFDTRAEANVLKFKLAVLDGNPAAKAGTLNMKLPRMEVPAELDAVFGTKMPNWVSKNYSETTDIQLRVAETVAE